MAAAPGAELRLRLLAAAAGVPLLFLALWAGGYALAAVAAAASAAAAAEILALLRRTGRAPLLVYGGAAAGAACVAGSLALLVLTRAGDAGLAWAALAFLATYATDTGAFATGKLAGRRKMAPSISPGKTWEGAAGGFLCGLAAVVALVFLLDGIADALLPAVALGVALPVAAQAGDLAESKLKRMAGAKDSGRLIPGHGGMLDRLDSLAAVFPLVYVAARLWPD